MEEEEHCGVPPSLDVTPPYSSSSSAVNGGSPLSLSLLQVAGAQSVVTKEGKESGRCGEREGESTMTKKKEEREAANNNREVDQD